MARMPQGSTDLETSICQDKQVSTFRRFDASTFPRRCLVVMYHYVHDTEPMTAEGVKGLTSREFRLQLDRLCSAAEPIDWPALFAWSRGHGTLPQRCFLLTFDDGLADHARVVLPILQERGLRGTFFVPGAVLDSERLLPAHAIHLLLSTLGVPCVAQ